VFAYVCIDFGFWRKIFGFEDETERVWRAGIEATIGATLIIFLFAYLNLRRWHVRFLHIGLVWLLLMAAVVGLSIYNAPVAAGVARISIATVAAIGFLLILSMAARGSDRAVMLIPTWFLLVVWVAAAGAAALGELTNDIVAPGLIGGLVLIVMLIGFTIMQSAFANTGAAGPSGADAERRALAMTGCGDAIFDWNVPADQIYVSGEIESQLGLKRGSLEGPAASWLDILHPLDRDRFSAALEGVLQQRSGRISHDIRLRGADSRYHSFTLKARPVVNAAGEVVRVIGALSDVTEIKTAEERILHDAIHDNLTGLPNRELFLDRLGAAIVQAERPGAPTPATLAIDVDRFKEVNDALGMAFGDSALLAVARRLGRELKPGDTLARIGGDQFGVIVLFDDVEADLERFVASLKGMMASPISFGDREVALTVSIGVVSFDPVLHKKGADLLADAEVALANAKKAGGDCAETFAVRMRATRSDRQSLAHDLRHALDRGQINVMFQPIVRLEDRTVAGFEALPRWRHPRLGLLGPADFYSLADANEALVEIGVFAIETTARELAAWQKALEVTPPIFASINVSARQLLAHDLLSDVRTALNRHYVLRGTLKLELAEALVMENPEYALQLLRRVRELGAGLALDDFGAGFTSLSHLQRYRFDTLKVDPSLVRPNGAGGRPAILRSVIAMAHDLGMDVITEGAETESDAVELSQLGCEFAQGYAFGEPMSAASARKLMGAEAL
jgi:diguanylate cyclase (GGDEF)-like protein/PAS domain S-box-containing protein